jgi:3-hydroxy-9,10-secoandrosta-1,3,5(10)-triene-9,17-dione monooxygenase
MIKGDVHMVMKMVDAQTQTVEEMLLEGAKRIGELAEKEAQTAEKNATISENVVNLIKETQISRIMLPKKYGGPQVDLIFFQLIYQKKVGMKLLIKAD